MQYFSQISLLTEACPDCPIEHCPLPPVISSLLQSPHFPIAFAIFSCIIAAAAAAAAAKSLQSCLTLLDPIDNSPPGSPHPWHSPGKNTGVGCHFLLQCMKVKSESEVTQSCLTLSDPMDCCLPSSSIRGIFQARVLSCIIEYAYYINCLFLSLSTRI